MNLNECIVNPRNKSKAAKNFVITAKNDRLNELCSNSSIEQIPPGPSKKTKKCPTVDSSGTKWGSAFISVLNSTSTRKSTSTKVTDENNSRFIVALTEGRGQAQCEVGIAIISVSTHHLIICQISDSQNYINTLTKINILNPNEILFPSTFENFGGNRLITKVKEQFPNIRYTSVPRSVFNKSSCLDMLTQLCIPSLNGVLLVIKHRYYALAAACALLTYIQDNLCVYFARGSLKIDYQECEGYALIDISTADRLELVCSAKPAQANKFSSLLGTLNYCLTKMGTRKLRSWILQPLCKVEYIEERLNCVEELMNNREALRSIQALLQKFTNVNCLLNLATIAPENSEKNSIRQLNYIISLNTIIDLIHPLEEIVAELKQPFFVKLRSILDNPSFTEIKNLIREVVSDYVQPTKEQNIIEYRCFAIKPGVNELLDVVRKIYSERLKDMKSYIEMLAEKYNLPLVLRNNQKKGYHIVLNIPKSKRKSMKTSELPDEFIEVNRCLTFFTMKTPDLVNISTRLDNIMVDILTISNVIVQCLVGKLKKHVYLFHTLCEELAQLDVYQSLARTSLENQYVRPTFGEYTEIKFGQHPLLNFLLPTKPIPNSIFCSDEYNVHIINGPNGSGKSIFIRQIMLLQIMAQLGCYIPAESAIFKPAKRMFARIYLEDKLEYNASSFVLEMKEMKYIMSSMTDDCLTVIDELGRSTSVEEGIALAAAILEHLACFSSYFYVTTHFTTLTKLHLMYPNIKTWQMETIPIGNDPKTFKLHYKYTLIPGITNVTRYGVYIVRNIWPDSIVADIDRSLDNLEKQQRRSLVSPLDPKSLKKYQLESEFKHLKRLGSLSDSKINQLIFQYERDLNALNHDLKLNIVFKYENDLNNSMQDILQEEGVLKEIFTPVGRCEDDFRLDNSIEESIVTNLDRSASSFIRNSDKFIPTNVVTPSLISNSSNDNSDFIRMLQPIVTIEETQGKIPENLISSQSTTYLSSLVPPDEYESICEEFNEDFQPEPPLENFTSDNMSKKNTYQYYISPVIVNVKEGLNYSSTDEENFDDNSQLNTVGNNKINIISNIVIREKNSLHENYQRVKNIEDNNGVVKENGFKSDNYLINNEISDDPEDFVDGTESSGDNFNTVEEKNEENYTFNVKSDHGLNKNDIPNDAVNILVGRENSGDNFNTAHEDYEETYKFNVKSHHGLYKKEISDDAVNVLDGREHSDDNFNTAHEGYEENYTFNVKSDHGLYKKQVSDDAVNVLDGREHSDDNFNTVHEGYEENYKFNVKSDHGLYKKQVSDDAVNILDGREHSDDNFNTAHEGYEENHKFNVKSDHGLYKKQVSDDAVNILDGREHSDNNFNTAHEGYEENYKFNVKSDHGLYKKQVSDDAVNVLDGREHSDDNFNTAHEGYEETYKFNVKSHHGLYKKEISDDAVNVLDGREHSDDNFNTAHEGYEENYTFNVKSDHGLYKKQVSDDAVNVLDGREHSDDNFNTAHEGYEENYKFNVKSDHGLYKKQVSDDAVNVLDGREHSDDNFNTAHEGYEENYKFNVKSDHGLYKKQVSDDAVNILDGREHSDDNFNTAHEGYEENYKFNVKSDHGLYKKQVSDDAVNVLDGREHSDDNFNTAHEGYEENYKFNVKSDHGLYKKQVSDDAVNVLDGREHSDDNFNTAHEGYEENYKFNVKSDHGLYKKQVSDDAVNVLDGREHSDDNFNTAHEGYEENYKFNVKSDHGLYKKQVSDDAVNVLDGREHSDDNFNTAHEGYEENHKFNVKSDHGLCKQEIPGNAEDVMEETEDSVDKFNTALEDNGEYFKFNVAETTTVNKKCAIDSSTTCSYTKSSENIKRLKKEKITELRTDKNKFQLKSKSLGVRKYTRKKNVHSRGSMEHQTMEVSCDLSTTEIFFTGSTFKEESETAKSPNNRDGYSNEDDNSSSNISSVSRKRNLDRPTETTTEDESKSSATRITTDGVSSASRKRNLDGSSSKQETTALSGSSSTKIVPVFRRVVKKMKSIETKEETIVNLDKKRKKMRRFVPPMKLTAKQIQKEFAEQDRKLLEGDFDLTTIVERRYNRPSVKQIQNATHLATLRKTPTGFEVIQSDERKKLRDAMMNRTFSNETMDMTIFSDRNAKCFDEFMNSKEGDIHSFMFNEPKQQEKLTFSFDKVANNENMFDDFIGNSNTNGNIEVRFTPDGYYKQNKREVDAVMCKYLNGTQSSRSEGRTFNIFGNSYLSNEDLDL